MRSSSTAVRSPCCPAQGRRVHATTPPPCNACPQPTGTVAAPARPPADRKAGALLRCHSVPSVDELHVPYIFPSEPVQPAATTACMPAFRTLPSVRACMLEAGTFLKRQRCRPLRRREWRAGRRALAGTGRPKQRQRPAGGSGGPGQQHAGAQLCGWHGGPESVFQAFVPACLWATACLRSTAQDACLPCNSHRSCGYRNALRCTAAVPIASHAFMQ